jgi:hypothetical protein
MNHEHLFSRDYMIWTPSIFRYSKEQKISEIWSFSFLRWADGEHLVIDWGYLFVTDPVV